MIGLLSGAIFCGSLGFYVLLRRGSRTATVLGAALLAAALTLLAMCLPWAGGWAYQISFWILGGIASLAAVGMIASRSAVYSALWFALVLLAVAGLFLLEGAHFLGIATIVVYAGAIVVTFLFVLMLAQSQGTDPYDRVSWGQFPLISGSLLGMLLIVGIAFTVLRIEAPAADLLPQERVERGVLHPQHMASLGGELFARHLVSVEIAGALLLVALVGAIAIVLQGRETEQPEQAAREGRFWNV